LAAFVFFGIGVLEHVRKESVTAFVFLVLSVPLFWIGAYISWSMKADDLDNAHKQLREVPHIKQVHGSFKCDARKWKDEETGTVSPICSLVVKFKNDPEFYSEMATAKEVMVCTTFFNIDVEQNPCLLFPVYSRGATNPEPKLRSPNKDILATDIRIGEEVELDIAVKYLDEDVAFAVDNEGYGSHALRHPKFRLEGKRFLAVVRLAAVNVKESFNFSFENEGKDKPLKPITYPKV